MNTLKLAQQGLTKKQKNALKLIHDGHSILITGPGGAGKSTMIQQIQTLNRLSRKATTLTASTGIAALQVQGITLHSFVGAGLAKGPKEAIVKAIRRSPRKVRGWKACQVLIIDEISMVSAKFFEKCEYAARQIRQDDRFFGGIQLVLVGDFYQLPPVREDRFVFELDCFKENITHIVHLTEVFRQSDQQFVRILSEIRQGNASEDAIRMLQERVGTDVAKEGVIPTRLLPTNREVDQYNQTQYDQLEAEEHIFEREEIVVGCNNAKMRQTILEAMDKKCPAVEILKLKEGAQVLLTMNLNVDMGLVNGTRGVVVEFNDIGLPVIRTSSGQTIDIEPNTWTEKHKDQTWKATMTQIPLRLAYAITIHRSQGMTLDLAEMALNKVFEHGQAYVALSRVRSLDGLSILDWDPSVIKAHPKVVEFYQTIE